MVEEGMEKWLKAEDCATMVENDERGWGMEESGIGERNFAFTNTEVGGSPIYR